MFSIGLRFLMERYYAQDPTYSTTQSSLAPVPEWPPAPARIFSALLAAAYQHTDTLSTEETAALKWLETLSAPSWAESTPTHFDARTQHGRVLRTAVPTNYANHKSALRYFTSIACDSPGYWIWPDADPAEHLPALTQLLHRVSYVGASASFVALWIENNPPPATLVPTDRHNDIHTLVHLPYPGRLSELQDIYAIGNRTRPTPGRTQGYREQSFKPAIPPTPSPESNPYDLLYVWTTEPAHISSITDVQHVTRQLRQAIMAQARTLSLPIPEALSGHHLPSNNESVPPPHCAYVALPHVGPHPHSDGHIVALAIAIPRTLTPADRQTVYRFLGSLQTLHYQHQTYHLTPGSYASPQAAMPERWTKPATQWTSVTPVIFDRFPTRKTPWLDVLNRMAHNAHLPPITAGTCLAHPPGGIPPASAFAIHRHAYHTPAALIQHLTITFAQPVSGPILLGALRHFGLGLFIPTSRLES